MYSLRLSSTFLDRQGDRQQLILNFEKDEKWNSNFFSVLGSRLLRHLLIPIFGFTQWFSNIYRKMKSLSLLLLFTILSSTMGGKERSQACTPTDGYACCFAPGEVGLLSPKFFSPFMYLFPRSYFFLPRWAWTTATATPGSFASSTAPTTWDIQTHNMMEPLRRVAVLIRIVKKYIIYVHLYVSYVHMI